MTPTYRLERDGEAIRCLVCNMLSHHPEDVKHRYCGWCHQFHPVKVDKTDTHKKGPPHAQA